MRYNGIVVTRDKYSMNSNLGKLELVKEALYAIRETTNICELMGIELDDVEFALNLCENDKLKFSDYEDALQYACAKKVGANFIVTNDKGFVSLDIEIVRTIGD